MENIGKTQNFKQETLHFDEPRLPPEKPYSEYTEEEKKIIRDSIFEKRPKISRNEKGKDGKPIEYSPQESRFIREEEEDDKESEHPWFH